LILGQNLATVKDVGETLQCNRRFRIGSSRGILWICWWTRTQTGNKMSSSFQ